MSCQSWANRSGRFSGRLRGIGTSVERIFLGLYLMRSIHTAAIGELHIGFVCCVIELLVGMAPVQKSGHKTFHEASSGPRSMALVELRLARERGGRCVSADTA